MSPIASSNPISGYGVTDQMDMSMFITYYVLIVLYIQYEQTTCTDALNTFNHMLNNSCINYL